MNLNRTRDYRETVTQAWRRMGLLEPSEPFNRERYVGCVEAAVEKLSEEGFLTKKVADDYVEQARTVKLPE